MPDGKKDEANIKRCIRTHRSQPLLGLASGLGKSCPDVAAAIRNTHLGNALSSHAVREIVVWIEREEQVDSCRVEGVREGDGERVSEGPSVYVVKGSPVFFWSLLVRPVRTAPDSMSLPVVSLAS